MQLCGTLQAIRETILSKHHYLLMLRRSDSLSHSYELFVKFFPFPKTRKYDLDVLVRLFTGEPYQVSCHIQYLDGCPHPQDENLTALSHGPCLNDHLRRLRYGHEIAIDIRMRHSNRSALLYLPPEERNHGS